MASASKFDVAILNPPYDGSLHLKILEKVIPHCEETINISPGNQMFAGKRLLKEHTLVKKSKVLKEHIRSVELIEPDRANKLFGVAFAGPLMLIHYDNSIDGIDYREFNTLNKMQREILNKTIKKWLDEGKKTIADAINEKSDKEYVLPTPEVHGHQNQSDWIEITSNNYERALKAKQRFGNHLAFDTEEERRNCYDSWHTTFHQFIHSLVKADNFNHFEFLPWMSDYTKPWTNKRFCDYFGITGYISDTEAEPDSEWEEILNTIEKYK